MNYNELSLLAVGLSMDAFAVAVCIGLTMVEANIAKALIIGLYFGAFQAGMPLAGYYAATQFAGKITAYDHWIVFGLLGILGGKMIGESLKKDGEEANNTEYSLKVSLMLPLALAVSIDALAVGVSFAFIQVDIIPAVLLIGFVTLSISMIGVKIGKVFGVRFKSKAQFAGGIILLLIGIKILIEHLIY